MEGNRKGRTTFEKGRFGRHVAGHLADGPDESEELGHLQDSVAVHVVEAEDPAQPVLRRPLADGRQEHEQLLHPPVQQQQQRIE